MQEDYVDSYGSGGIMRFVVTSQELTMKVANASAVDVAVEKEIERLSNEGFFGGVFVTGTLIAALVLLWGCYRYSRMTGKNLSGKKWWPFG